MLRALEFTNNEPTKIGCDGFSSYCHKLLACSMGKETSYVPHPILEIFTSEKKLEVLQ
jgi:hypothetical protein